MMIRFRFLLDSLRSGLARTSAARPLLTYAAALLGPPLPGPYLRTYVAAMHAVDVSEIPICCFVSETKFAAEF